MRPFVPVVYRGWKGLNEDENPSVLTEGELSNAINVAMLGGLLGTRPGLQRESSGEDYAATYTHTKTGDESVTLIYDFRQGTDFKGTRGSSGDSILATITLGKTTNDVAEVWTDDGTAIAIGAGGTVMTAGIDNVWVATTFKEYMFYAGGLNVQTTSTDTFNYVDPLTPGVPTKVVIPHLAGTPTSGFPKYCTTKWGYVFANGINPIAGEIDNSYNKMITRFQTIGTDPITAANWETGNSIGTGSQIGDLGGLADYGDEFTTGFGHYQDAEGDWLLILTNKKIASITRHPETGDFVHDDDIANGCVHQRAFVSLGVDAGDAIYMSDRGIHSLRQSQQHSGREDSFLSWKIRRTFEGLSPDRLHLACGAYDSVEGWVLFAVSTASQTSHDKILCLDIKNSRDLTAENAIWYVWTIPEEFRINCMTEALDHQGNRRIYVGTVADSDTASVGRFTRDVFTDFGTGYNTTWCTRYADQGSPSIEKLLGNMYVDTAPPGNYSPTVKAKFDYGQRNDSPKALPLPGNPAGVWGTDSWNEFDWGSANQIVRQQKIYLQGRFHNVAFEFSHSSSNEPFYIAGFTQEMAPLADSRSS